MTTKAEWIALAERCEKATGSDREIDAAVMAALRFVKHGWFEHDGAKEWHWAIEGTGVFFKGRLTASLDAITALIERELPDYHWRIQGGRKDTGWTQMSGDPRAYIKAKASRLVQHTDGKDGEAATPAIALCAAFCRAMAEKVTT
jgi:hypothetical protein